MAVNNSFNLLNIYTGTTEIGRLEFQYVATGYRLRAGGRNDASAYTYTPWTTLTDSAHVLEIDWRAATGPGANNGGLTLWIDGAQVGALTAVDNDTRRVDKANIGAVGLDVGTTGTFYLDAFESRRESAIGPVQVAGSALTTTTITYGCDPLYRLTSATYSDGTLFGYAYDAVGNVLTKTQTIAGTPTLQTYAYDDANRQTSAAGLAQTYDNNGNLLNDGATAYTWDGANRMAASGSTAYSYNGLNDRVSAGGVTHQLDLNAGLAQVLADGTNTYLYGAGRVGEQQAAAWQYHLTDGLGSVRQLANASGAVSAAKSYEPYGEVLSSAGTASSAYGFTGEQQAGNLVYLRARYFQVEAMRFASKDTWEGDDLRPRSFNRWGYVYGNVVTWTDPSGQTACNLLPQEDRAECEGKAAYSPNVRQYNETTSPAGVTWFPYQKHEFIANILKGFDEPEYEGDGLLKGRQVASGSARAQYQIHHKWYGLCGQVSAAAILSGFGLKTTANTVVARYVNAVKSGLISDTSGDMPNVTGPAQIASLLRILYPDKVDVPKSGVYTSDYGMSWRNRNWGGRMRSLLERGYVFLVGALIDGTGRVSSSASIQHWVVLTGMSSQWNHKPTEKASRSPWNWVRIYNPFENQTEYYWFGDFKDSWSADGNMMVPVRLRSR